MPDPNRKRHMCIKYIDKSMVCDPSYAAGKYLMTEGRNINEVVLSNGNCGQLSGGSVISPEQDDGD